MSDYTRIELEEAQRQIASLISKCEKVRLKLREGTPQSSLLANRIKAFYISSSLIAAKMADDEALGADS